MRAVINPTAEHPDLLFNQNEPAFGTAAVVRGEALYVYGCNTDGADKPCMVGQVGLTDVLDRIAWTFYTGNGTWSQHIKDSAPAFCGGSIMNVSWNDYLQRYVALYSAPFSKNVMMRTSPNPEGSWSSEVQAFTARQPERGGTVYDALAHPEYNRNGGQLMYVSYSRFHWTVLKRGPSGGGGSESSQLSHRHRSRA